MQHLDVVRGLLPLVERELGDTSALSLAASMSAFAKWQEGNRSVKALPGVGAMPNGHLSAPLLAATYRVMRLAAATYGWKGQVFFAMTDASGEMALGELGGLLRSSAQGDAASFCHFAGLPRDALLYESPAAKLGVPKHFLVADAASRNLVLAVRGTMSLDDALTDVVTESLPFCGGVAHKGIAHAAHAIFAALVDVLERELRARPEWGLLVTGHSLGAATAILFTILAHEARAKQRADPRVPRDAIWLDGVDIRAVVFAPPPVFAPLSALPDATRAAIACWVHGTDIIPRLSLHSVRDVVRIMRKIGDAEPSHARRMWSGADVDGVLATEPEWLATWHGRPTTYTPDPERYAIPGTIYCFRAPVDVSAASSLRLLGTAPAAARSHSPAHLGVGAAAGSESPTTPSATLPTRSTPPPPPAPASAPAAAAGPPPSTAAWMVSSLSGWVSAAGSVASTAVSSTVGVVGSTVGVVGSTVGAVGSTAVGIVSGTLASAADSISSVLSSAGGGASSSGGGGGSGGSSGGGVSSLGPGRERRPMPSDARSWMRGPELERAIATEALARAATDHFPIVTVATADNLRCLPLTNRAWRDHVPDMYLNVLRQLQQVAEAQAALDPSLAPPQPPPPTMTATATVAHSSDSSGGGGGGGGARAPGTGLPKGGAVGGVPLPVSSSASAATPSPTPAATLPLTIVRADGMVACLDPTCVVAGADKGRTDAAAAIRDLERAEAAALGEDDGDE